MNKSLVDNAMDEEQVERGQRIERELHKLRVAALTAIAATRDGEILFDWLMEMGAVFQSSFSLDVLSIAFNEGRRSLGNQIMDTWTSVRPDAFAVSVTERAERVKRNG